MLGRQPLPRLLAPVIAAALVLAGCGGDDDSSSDAGSSEPAVSISEAWSRQPAAGQATAAVYAVVSNAGDADVTIVAASSPVTDRVELHETIANDDGTMQMREVDGGFVVPAGGDFAFESGGPHIMLFGIDAASYPSDQVEVTLEFDSGDPVTFDAEVRPLDGDESDMGSMDMGDGSESDMESMDADSMDSGSMDMGVESESDMESMDMNDGTVHVMIDVADGVVTTDDERPEIALGSSVNITVNADVIDEVHVHGYDLHGDVSADSPAQISFAADIPGLFEVELEDAGLLLVELQVS